MEARFDVDLFNTRYQRNNKFGGLKNIRCYPTCGTEHRERGFCGRSVSLYLSVPPTLSIMDLSSFAEFVPTTIDVYPPSVRREGDVVTMTEALGLVRDKDHPTRPWLDGFIHRTTDVGNEVEIVFNKERRGWHYGWASNKHTCNANHAFQVYVCERTVAGYKVLKIFRSPEFLVFCRRRHRYEIEPRGPTAGSTSMSSIDVKKETHSITDDDATSASSETLEDDLLLKMEGVENRIETLELAAPQEQRHGAPMNFSNKRASSPEDATTTPSVKRPCLISELDGRRTSTTSSPPSSTNSTKVDEKELRRLERILRAVTVHVARVDGYPILEDDGLARLSTVRRGASILGTAPSSVSLSEINDVFLKEVDDIGSIGGSTINPVDFDDDDVDGDALSFKVPKSLRQNPVISTMTDRMARELANFMIEEHEFTEEIASVLTSNCERVDPKLRFRKFVDALTRFLDAFMAKTGMNRDQFDEMLNISNGENGDDDASWGGADTASFTSSQWFPSPENVVEPIVRKDTLAKGRRFFETGAHGAFDAVSKDLRAGMRVEKDIRTKLQQRNLRPCSSFNETMQRIHDPIALTGSWELLDSSNENEESSIDSLRTGMGHPWLLRRLLDYMEKKFEIGVVKKFGSTKKNGVTVVDRILIHLQRKLFSSGAMVVLLDGEEHPWSLSLPVFQGLSLEWHYRAWLDEFGSVHHIHDCGHRIRMNRVITMDEDQSHLTITSVLEELYDPAPGEERMPDPAADHSKEIWVPKARAMQRAKRIVE